MEVNSRIPGAMFSLATAAALVLALTACGGGGRRGGVFTDSGTVRSDSGEMPMTDAGTVPRVDSGIIAMMDAGTVPRVDSGVIPRPDAGPPRVDSGVVPRVDAGGLPPLPDGGGLGMCASVADCAAGNDCCMLFPGLGLCLPAGSCPTP